MSLPVLLVCAFVIASCGARSKSSADETQPSTSPPVTVETALAEAPPLAAKVPVTDQYYDEALVDDYRWLENWEDPKVQAWTHAMDDYSRATLAAMPQVDAIRARVLRDEKVNLDPNLLDASGSTTIDFYRPSPDGILVAVSLSKGGSESGNVYVYDVASGKAVHEVVSRVNGGTAGGNLAWQTDSKGFSTPVTRAVMSACRRL